MSARAEKNFPALPSILAMLGAIMQREGSTVSSAQSRRWCSSWLGAGIVLILLCLAVYLPGLRSIPPVDRDECRFAQASRTMLESGDFVVPRIQNTPRLNKPPLIYWLQSGSAYLLGDAPGTDGLGQWGNGNIWVFRLPSALCAIGTILLTWRMGLRMFDPRAAALAAALLAVCPMVVWDAHQARADQLLLFTTTGTMFALFVCWKKSQKHTQRVAHAPSESVARAPRLPVVLQQKFLWPVAFWAFLALGILAKGPITPLIAALTIITLCISTRSLRWLLHLRPLLGLLILTALVDPWVYAIIHRVGWSTYWPIILKETIGRSTDAAENHWGPPGYHTILLAALFWPGSLLTLAAITRACRAFPWHGRPARVFARRRADVFLLASLLPAWLLFECIATKLPHYTMPLYPAIALLTARAACAAMSSRTSLLRTAFDRIGVILWGGIGLAGLLGSLGMFVEFGGFDWSSPSYGRTGIVLATLAIFISIIAACFLILRRRAIVFGHALAMLAVIVWCWTTLEFTLPRCREFWVSSKLMEHVQDKQLKETSRAAPIALIGYQEPSAIFLSHGRAIPIELKDLHEWIETHPHGIAVVQAENGKPDGNDIEMLTMKDNFVTGYNYSSGGRVELRIYGLDAHPQRRWMPRTTP